MKSTSVFVLGTSTVSRKGLYRITPDFLLAQEHLDDETEVELETTMRSGMMAKRTQHLLMALSISGDDRYVSAVSLLLSISQQLASAVSANSLGLSMLGVPLPCMMRCILAAVLWLSARTLVTTDCNLIILIFLGAWCRLLRRTLTKVPRPHLARWCERSYEDIRSIC